MITLSPPYFAVVFIGSTIFALQQLSGINAVFYFSSTVSKSFGAPSDLANICVGIANLSGMVGFTLKHFICASFRLCLFVSSCIHCTIIFIFWSVSLCYSRVSCCNDLDG